MEEHHAITRSEADQTEPATPQIKPAIGQMAGGGLPFDDSLPLGGPLAGPPPPDQFASRLLMLDRTTRSRYLLQLQRQHGNEHVQRLLAQRTPAAASPSNVAILQRDGLGKGQKHTIKAPKKEIKVDKSIGKLPIKLEKIALSGEFSIEEEPTGAAGQASNQARGGATGTPGEGGGLQAEVGHKWGEWQDTALGNISVNSKATGELTTAGGEMGLELLGVEFERVTFTLKFTIISYEKEKSEISLATTSLQVGVIPIKGTGNFQGTPYKYELKPTAEFIFGLDKARVAMWLAEKFAEVASAELAIAAGLVVGGFATIAAAIVTAALGSEIAQRVDQAVKNTNEFCQAYQSTLRGEDVLIKSTWGNQGYTTADGVRSKSKVPKDALYAEAKKRNLRGEAFAAGWPKVQAAMLADYREEHWFEWKVYGEDGPGYKILKRLLDARHLNF